MMAMGMHRPRKRFGQNFLVDRGIVAKVLAVIDPKAEDRVVEIGPGLGALTRTAVGTLPRLDVVEIDRDLAGNARGTFLPGIVSCSRWRRAGVRFLLAGSGLRVVGNLPYNISTPLFFHLAASSHCVRDCHFMLQREVVQRMAAEPGGKEYGRLTVMLQYRFEVEQLFRVPSGAFNPAPQVESAFVRLIPHRQLPARRLTRACSRRWCAPPLRSGGRRCETRCETIPARKSWSCSVSTLG